MQKAADAVQRFANGYLLRLADCGKLILCGDTGNGKTMMGAAVYRWASRIGFYAWENGFWKVQPSACFHRWQALSDQIETGGSFAGVLDPILENQLIVVDDIGAETDRYRSEKSLDALSYLLSQTEEAHWLLLTTNFKPSQWRERFDERIEDRLLRDAVVCDLSAVPSWSKL